MSRKTSVGCPDEPERDRSNDTDRLPLLAGGGLKENQRQTLLDEASNLYNQEFFLNLLHYEITRGKRYKRPVAVVLISLDENVGSIGVASLAEVLHTSIRAVEHGGRLGAGQIGIILPETNREGASAAVKRIRSRLHTSCLPEQTQAIRIGFAVFPTNGRDSDELLMRATQALA